MASQPAPQRPEPEDDFWSVELADNEILIRLSTEDAVSGSEIGKLVQQLEGVARTYGLFDEAGFFEIVSLEQGSILLRLKAWHDRTTEWRKAATEYATIGGFLVAFAVAVSTLTGEDARAEDPVECPDPVTRIEVRSNNNSFEATPKSTKPSAFQYFYPKDAVKDEEEVFGQVIVDPLSGHYAVVADDGRIITVRLAEGIENQQLFKDASITVLTMHGDNIPTVTQISVWT